MQSTVENQQTQRRFGPNGLERFQGDSGTGFGGGGGGPAVPLNQQLGNMAYGDPASSSLNETLTPSMPSHSVPGETSVSAQHISLSRLTRQQLQNLQSLQAKVAAAPVQQQQQLLSRLTPQQQQLLMLLQEQLGQQGGLSQGGYGSTSTRPLQSGPQYQSQMIADQQHVFQQQRGHHQQPLPQSYQPQYFQQPQNLHQNSNSHNHNQNHNHLQQRVQQQHMFQQQSHQPLQYLNMINHQSEPPRISEVGGLPRNPPDQLAPSVDQLGLSVPLSEPPRLGLGGPINNPVHSGEPLVQQLQHYLGGGPSTHAVGDFLDRLRQANPLKHQQLLAMRHHNTALPPTPMNQLFASLPQENNAILNARMPNSQALPGGGRPGFNFSGGEDVTVSQPGKDQFSQLQLLFQGDEDAMFQSSPAYRPSPQNLP